MASSTMLGILEYHHFQLLGEMLGRFPFFLKQIVYKKVWCWEYKNIFTEDNLLIGNK